MAVTESGSSPASEIIHPPTILAEWAELLTREAWTTIDRAYIVVGRAEAEVEMVKQHLAQHREAAGQE